MLAAGASSSRATAAGCPIYNDPPPSTWPVCSDARLFNDARALNSTKPLYTDFPRADWGQVPIKLKALAKANVALVNASQLQLQPNGNYKPQPHTLAEQIRKSSRDETPLCANERFANQEVLAFCSGVLVGTSRDVVATAGHCLMDSHAPPLTEIWVVFGFYSSDENDPGPAEISADLVFSIKELLDFKCTDRADDWARIRLDRPVGANIAEPIIQITKYSVPDNGDFFVFGYPTGLPLKYAPGGKLSGRLGPLFRTDLNTFAGNSGSGVFMQSSDGEELVGIMVHGEPKDYCRDRTKNCIKAYKCPENGCTGENVQRIEKTPLKPN